MNIFRSQFSKNRIISFIWQHVLLLFALYVMTLGVVLCIKSDLGSSVITSLPLSLSMAGSLGLVPNLTVGEYIIVMNFLYVVLQIVILRRQFELVQLFQLAIGWVAGWLIDPNMMITSCIVCKNLFECSLAQIIGCTVMAVGIAFEVRCGSVTMPGEGLPVAISRVTGVSFAKIKIYMDTVFVILAIGSCYLFLGSWQWNVIGPGTLFAMIYAGLVIKLVSPYLGWFDRLLHYQPGFRRYIFGLANYIYRKDNK